MRRVFGARLSPTLDQRVGSGCGPRCRAFRAALPGTVKPGGRRCIPPAGQGPVPGSLGYHKPLLQGKPPALVAQIVERCPEFRRLYEYLDAHHLWQDEKVKTGARAVLAGDWAPRAPSRDHRSTLSFSFFFFFFHFQRLQELQEECLNAMRTVGHPQ